MSQDQQLLDALKALETALHARSVRSNRHELDQLLHPAFREFGRSGLAYSRAEILDRLPEEPSPPVIWSQGFQVQQLGDGAALLTYQSANLQPSGELQGHAQRSSVWLHNGQDWQMVFHQGTPCAPFERQANPMT